MKPVLTAAAAAALLIGPSAMAQTSTGILPGYWEATNRVSFFVQKTTVEKKCVKQADLDRFFSGPSNRHYKCVYPTRAVADGKARFEGVCTDKRGRKAYVTASGTYSPNAFKLKAKIRTSIIGVPITPTGKMSARRIGDVCPPGAKGL